MRKLSVFLSVVFSVFVWFSFASPSILNPSYSTNWDDVKIYWTNNSDWWYMDINLKDPKTNDWLHFGEVKMSDQVFTYTKQWDWDQQIQIIPWDWWDIKEFIISSEKWLVEMTNNWASDNNKAWNWQDANRTVIPVVPKTWPTGSLIWIILATLAIFGGYIYIKRKADI